MLKLTRLGFVLPLTLVTAGVASYSALAQQRQMHRGVQSRPGHGLTVRPPAPPRGRPPVPPRGRAFAPPARSGAPGRRPVGPTVAAPRPVPRRFTSREFSRFTPVERRLWQSGRWQHDWHSNLYGWWWVVGSTWYFYPQAIYPYPVYVSDYWWQEPIAPVYPTGYWYYCSASDAYYPDVQTCDVPWTPVLPAPPG